jgi:uncharacterized delta-60 repeat protein
MRSVRHLALLLAIGPLALGLAHCGGGGDASPPPGADAGDPDAPPGLTGEPSGLGGISTGPVRLVQGKATEVTVDIVRTGAPQPVTLSIEAPPVGISAPPATIPAGDATGKLLITAAKNGGGPDSVQGETQLEIKATTGTSSVTTTVDALVAGAPGSLDETFATGGGRPGAVDLGAVFAPGKAPVLKGMVQAASGRTVLLYDVGEAGIHHVGLVAVDADGKLDGTFGTNGVFQFGGDQSFPYGLLVEPSGRILVYGNLQDAGSGRYFGAVWAVTTSGTLDTSYGGAGTGKRSIIFGLYSMVNVVRAAALSPSGALVIGGSTESDGFIQRITSAGLTDVTFKGAGLDVTLAGGAFLIHANPGETCRVSSLLTQADGSILGNVTKVAAGGATDVVYALDATGAAIPTFGTSGSKQMPFAASSTDFASGMALSPSGTVTIGTCVGDHAGLGQILASTGAESPFTSPLPAEPEPCRFENVELAADGKILVMWYGATPDELMLARLLPSGALDPEFAQGGLFPETAQLSGIDGARFTQQKDGRILLSATGIAGTPGLYRIWN